jgi:uncharacterized protein YutE (UPF0331/DUF86 family)
VIDLPLLHKKLAFLETCVRQLQDHANAQVLQTDIKERRFVEHTLQLAIQAAIDAASHVVSDRRLGEPTTNRELFALLAAAGLVEAEDAEVLGRMAAFRNVLVHGYAEVDLEILRGVLTDHLDDLTRFAGALRAAFQPAT